MAATVISAEQFAAAGLGDWRWTLNDIRAQFVVTPFTAAAELVRSMAAAADAADHHPDIDLRYPGRVLVAMVSHSAGTVTSLDVELAGTISALAAAAGAVSEPLASQAVEIAIDTMDADRIRPFWQAVLGYRQHRGALVDPLHVGPPVWFQQMDVDRPGRGRLHIDVSVADDEAERRIAAALAAGGTMVSDAHARAWWVLADADGNEACVCTWQDRGGS
jgi:4a-hydroxytetrahydrobiopterin dehydratase